MQIFNDKKERIGILEQFKDRKIIETLDSGDKELTFKYPCNGSQLGFLREENYIRTKTDEYVLRAHKKNGSWIEYTAQLNVEELEGQVFPFGFESREQTIRSCLEFAFEGTGWKIGECTVKKKRTINKDEETNAWDILQDCLSTYRCECKIHSLKKTIDIYETIGSDKGAYFIEGLNLKKLTASIDTYDFFTRLIPLGKDGIGIDITGKNYIENYQYSEKVKTYVWSDERYTNTTSLLEDATAKLEEISKPYIAYTADIIDLASQSDKYNVLDFEIGDTVWIISKENRTKEKQRIVKKTEYPEMPWENTVELANISKTFAQIQAESTESAKAEAIQIAKKSTKKILGDYPTTETVNSALKTKSDEIIGEVSRTLESYSTKEDVKSAIKVSVDGITDTVSKKFEDYSTKEEINSILKQQAEDVVIAVSKTYETKENSEKKINDLKEFTDDKLKEYSTTEQVTSAIKVAIGELTLSVENEKESSTLKLMAGETELASKEIKMTGLVKFSDLEEEGNTSISGSNITTGIIKDKTGNTSWDLEEGIITSKKLVINSQNFKLSEAGKVEMTGATVNGGKITQNTNTTHFEISDGSIKGAYNGEYENEIDFTNRIYGLSAMAICGEYAIQIRTPTIYISQSVSGSNTYKTYTGERDGHTYINGLMVI